MKIIRLAICVVLVLFGMSTAVSSQESTQIQKIIDELQAKISDLQGQERTFASQINLLNSQIALTSLKITSTKGAIDKLSKEISDLANEIDMLEVKLTKRTELVLRRIPESYKRQVTPVFGLLFLSRDFPNFIARVKYLKTLEEQDAQLLFQLKATQNNFTERKSLREQKKTQQEALGKQLQAENRQLDQQKRDKQVLLEQTKNSEAVYQQLLAQARAEQQAIKDIIAGGGVEVNVGGIKAGDRIASIISGNSCNSSGTHLHFIVEKNGVMENPFTYVKNIAYENCSGYRCGDNEGDSFNPSGSWDWPIDGPIKFSQGYGSTWATKHTWVGQVYTFHNGIDISGSSLTVKAIQPGDLYRGNYSGYNGCRLQYVKVEHSNSQLKSYYLHINY